MSRSFVHPAKYLLVLGSLLVAAPAAAQIVSPDLPTVEDVICLCDLQGGVSRIQIRWDDPREAGFESIVILLEIPPRSGQLQPIQTVEPGVMSFLLEDFQLGEAVTIGVSTQVDNEISIPVVCAVICPPLVPDPPPNAVISPLTPRRLVQKRGQDLIFVVDGRASSDFRGTQNLKYFWHTDPTLEGLVEFLEPRSAVCRVLVRPLNDQLPQLILPLQLRVVAKGSLQRQEAVTDAEEFRIMIQREDPRGAGQRRAVQPIHPLYLTALGNPPELLAIGERLHHVDFQINISGSGPFPQFQLLEGPDGLDVDLETGVVHWTPSVFQAGQTHDVVVNVRDPQQPEIQIDVGFTIAVVDAARAPDLYGFGANRNGFEPRGAGAGGAGGVLPPPEFVSDRTAVPLPLALHLIIPQRNEACAVDLSIGEGLPGGGNSTTGVRFRPDCARDGDGDGGGGGDGGGAGLPPMSGASGGYYTSGSAASGAAQAMSDSDEMTVELWVSSVADFQPGASSIGAGAYIFSQSKGTSSLFNWRITVEDEPGSAQRYVAEVTTDTEVVRLEAVADLSSASDHQIILTRRYTTTAGPIVHSLFINGVEAASAETTGSLKDFEKTYEIFVGAAQGGANPFKGTVSTCGVYAKGLSDAMIAYMRGLGPGDPAPGEVEIPTATICPDPHEIIRTRWGADGSDSEDGFPEVPPGPMGFGAGVSCGDFLDFLYPCEWSVLPSHPEVTIRPVTGFERCRTKVEIDFPAPEAPGVEGRREWEVTLLVRQVAVRGAPALESMPETRTVTIARDFLRGDVNGDGRLDVSDPTWLLRLLFLESDVTLPCRKAADFDNNEMLDIADAQLELMFLFLGGSAPPAPGPSTCGFDDGGVPPKWLSCHTYGSCP